MKMMRIASVFLLVFVTSGGTREDVAVTNDCNEFHDWTELDYFWTNLFGLRDEHYHNASDGPNAEDLMGGGQWPDEGPEKVTATGYHHHYLMEKWTLESLEHTTCTMT